MLSGVDRSARTLGGVRTESQAADPHSLTCKLALSFVTCIGKVGELGAPHRPEMS